MASSSARRSILHAFPQLGREFRITSRATPVYNCAAWALQDAHRWWWPLGRHYWPPNCPREETVAAFKIAFQSRGFSEGETCDYQDAIEKIVLFADKDGVPTHVARQLSNGRWTSKLGVREDISHGLAQGCEGDLYGNIALVMSRPIAGRSSRRERREDGADGELSHA